MKMGAVRRGKSHWITFEWLRVCGMPHRRADVRNICLHSVILASALLPWGCHSGDSGGAAGTGGGSGTTGAAGTGSGTGTGGSATGGSGSGGRGGTGAGGAPATGSEDSGTGAGGLGAGDTPVT